MSFLTWLATFLLNWAVGKVSAFFADLTAKLARRGEIAKQADASVEPLKKAETAEEIDAAAREALDGF